MYRRIIRLYSQTSVRADSGVKNIASIKADVNALGTKETGDISTEESSARRLLDLKYKAKTLISRLNSTPNDLINSRITKLQQQLLEIDSDKVKHLDEELTEFMLSHLKMPLSETGNRPWSSITERRNTIDLGENSQEPGTFVHSSTSNSLTSQYPYLRPSQDNQPYTTQELYLRYINHSRQSGTLGSRITNIYKPKNDIKQPKAIEDITISTLMAAGCHLGHAKSSWRPSTQPFIYGVYNGIHLIDLNETIVALNRAVKVVKGIANKGGIILYVGTLKHWEQQRALEEAAKRSNGYYIWKKWIAGTITNFQQVIHQQGEKKIEIDMMNKPTNRRLESHEIDGLLKPDLVVIMNPTMNRNCINECIKARIPTIGLCDTDMEPSLLTYPIPSNDDSLRVSSLMLGLFSRAAQDGITDRLETIKLYKDN